MDITSGAAIDWVTNRDAANARTREELVSLLDLEVMASDGPFQAYSQSLNRSGIFTYTRWGNC